MVENNLDIGGGVVFWTLADHTDRDKLREAFRPLDLENHVPEPRLPSAVLRDALEEVLGGSRVLVRPLADRDGFTVVREERGRTNNAYVTELVAKVACPDPIRLDIEPLDERASLIHDACRRHAVRIPAAQMSAAMVRIVESLGGTRLRPGGAVYWVPGPKLDDWTQAAEAVEKSSEGRPSAVYVLRHKLDADAVRAVRDAVITEVRAEASRIQTEVSSGELGGRALETRKRQAAELRRKVNLYEDILSIALSGLHQAVDEADQAAAMASLLISAEPAGAVP
ncbi:hypothetical protein [Zavarzinella formosa]|uniref:hypothetical protein n=1 Tax=Zavarzinella formosa TaxID=360055 RepID=UPI0003168832|nr:hypothetical protein [Zavarzinella formosa]